MNRTALALVTLLVPVAGSAHGTPGEHAGALFEPRHDRQELRDDRRDLFRAESLLARFDEAVSRRSRYALAGVEHDVLRMLDVEIRQAELEIARSRDELRRNRRTPWVGAAHRDRRFMGDARRDLRDDRRDVRRVRAIRSEFSSLRGLIDRRAIEAKRGLVAELVHIARAELGEDRREVREHRREGCYRAG